MGEWFFTIFGGAVVMGTGFFFGIGCVLSVLQNLHVIPRPEPHRIVPREVVEEVEVTDNENKKSEEEPLIVVVIPDEPEVVEEEAADEVTAEK